MRFARLFPVLALVLSTGCWWWDDDRPRDDDERCPQTMPDEGDYCVGTQTCTYGGLACQCGHCAPAYGCTCVDGSWQCWHTDPMNCPDVIEDVVPDVEEDTPPEVLWDYVPDGMWDPGPDTDVPFGCPPEPPIGVDEYCGEYRTCEYGTECCCGNCYPSLVCTCNGAGWGCYYTDACMIPNCGDVVEDVHEYWQEDVQDVPDVQDVGPGFDFIMPACCGKNADCGPGWVCGGGHAGLGTCKPALTYGECWSQEDCPTGYTCMGASVCACDADCAEPDRSGTCVPMPTGCCWVDADCDAGKVCRAQGGLGDLPGSCVDDPAGPSCIGDVACCWEDADCGVGTRCQGASVCGCIDLCPMCGMCAPDQMGTCG